MLLDMWFNSLAPHRPKLQLASETVMMKNVTMKREQDGQLKCKIGNEGVRPRQGPLT
jgi:hypothetical protein